MRVFNVSIFVLCDAFKRTFSTAHAGYLLWQIRSYQEEDLAAARFMKMAVNSHGTTSGKQNSCSIVKRALIATVSATHVPESKQQ